MTTRRRLIDDEPEQLALALPKPRRRIELAEVQTSLADVSHLEAQRFTAMPTIVSLLTEWEGKVPPPCSGFWDVKQKSAREGSVVRWWYGLLDGNWWWRCNAVRMDSAAFLALYEWRGLALRPAGGYPYALEYPCAADMQAGSKRRRIED